MMSLGRHVYGLSAVALGVVGLLWADFAAVWQPVPADFPQRVPLAYAAAALFLIGGLALQLRRTAPLAGLLVAALHAIFAGLWAVRVIGYPQIFGTWSGFAEQVAIALGGITVFASLSAPNWRGRALLIYQWIFGLCLCAFGAAHIIYVNETAALVPAYMPLTPETWAYITGAAHLAAGLAFLSGVLAVCAARLIVVMFVGFGAMVWAPQLLGANVEHMAWAGNAINLALVGAAWVMADAIALRTKT